MPAAVPAIPPKPKIAAMIAITRNVNAQLSMIKLRAAHYALNQVCCYSAGQADPSLGPSLAEITERSHVGSLPTIKVIDENLMLVSRHENSTATHGNRAVLSGPGEMDIKPGHCL